MGVVGLGFRISRMARFHVEMGPLGEGPGENGTKTSQVWLPAYFLKTVARAAESMVFTAAAEHFLSVILRQVKID